MKCARLFGIVALALLFMAGQSLTSHAQMRAQGTFEALDNGQVVVDGLTFDSMEAYVNSTYFQTAGKRCGTIEPPASSLKSSDLKALADCTQTATIIQNEYWPESVLTIPVVVHVISKTDGTGNLSDARIQRQIQVLNEDYAARTGTLGANGFNTKIQFELVETTRTVNDTWYNDGNAESTYKAALGRDQSKFCNIYTNSASGYLGYAYFPQSNAGTLDGIVVYWEAFGGRDEGFSIYNQGRTLVHEMGHYLGLYHTFQGGSTCNNTYTGGDLIVDTPPESEAHYNCVQTTTCSTDDPIHNYMNYTPDACMDRFTSEQSNRAVCSLVNYRPDLPTTTSDSPSILYLLDFKKRNQQAN